MLEEDLAAEKANAKLPHGLIRLIRGTKRYKTAVVLDRGYRYVG